MAPYPPRPSHELSESGYAGLRRRGIPRRCDEEKSMSRQQRSPWSVFRLQGFRARLVGVIVIAGFFCIFINAGLFYAYVLDNYQIILKSTTLPPDVIAERYEDLGDFALALAALSFTVL